MERVKLSRSEALVILDASSANEASWVREMDRFRELVRLSKVSSPFCTKDMLLPTVARFPEMDWDKVSRYSSVCAAD